MSKAWFMFVGMLLVLAGCGTAPVRTNPNRQLPPNWDSDLGPAHEIENVVISRPTNGIVVAPTSPPPLRYNPAPLTTAESGMISLNRWATLSGLGAVRVLPLSPTPAHTVKTPYGSFTVRAGSLAAYWDRLEVRLGFKPQQIGDQIFLHALDIKKVLEPLSHGTTVLTSAKRLVVIDPGHGGSNTGTRNVVTGRYEKDYTLDWAKRLAPLLEQSHWRVVLTRTNDVNMSLAERVAFAEAQRADLFLSLHFNASGDGDQNPAGLETYCLTPVGMPSSLTRGYSDDARSVFPNNAFDVDNLRYAVRLQRSLLQVNGHKDRGVRHARFLDVLQGHNRPAVLIEAAYLSNPTEAKLVADAAYRQKLAEAVAKALE